MQWLLSLDPTVQVALFGALGAIVTGAIAFLRTILAPHSEEKEQKYGPKPMLVVLSDRDRAIMEELIKTLDQHADAIERHRLELGRDR